MRLDRVTLGQVWLAFGHRIGAVLVTTSILWLAMHVVRQYRERRDLLVPAVALVGLLVVQLTLGVVTVLWRKPADIASAHVAVGALTLVTAFVLTARAMRLFVPQRKTMDNAVPVFTPSELAAAI
jgi:heme A synthase